MLRHLLSTCLIALSTSADSNAGILQVPRDYASIQEAVSASAPGDRIRIAAGEYPETVSITDRTDLTLVGGKGVAITGLEIRSSRGVTIRGLTFLADTRWAIGVFFSADVTIDRCATTENTTALYSAHCDRLLVQRTTIRRARSGMKLHFGAGLTVRRCRFEQVGEEPIFVREVDGVLIENNRVHSTGNIDAWRSQGVRIRRNLLDHTGVTVRELDGAEVVGNRIDQPGRGGVSAFTCSNLSIRDNRVRAGSSLGVSLRYVDDSLIQKNRVQRCRAGGIQISGAGNEFVRNRASRNSPLDLDDRSPGQNLYRKNRFGTTNLTP